MVIWFNVEKARKYLEEHELVYTFRTKRKQFGYTSAVYTNKVLGRTTIFDVNVLKVDESHTSDSNNNHRSILSKYVEHSGFENIDEWLEEIRKVNFKERIPVYGMIIKVIRAMRCAQCGMWTDNYCIIEEGPKEENYIEYIWCQIGMTGKPICVECYYK